VVGRREIYFRTIGSGTSGPVSQEPQAAHHRLVRGKHPFSEKWPTQVK
jgi:hypothetical protein